MIYELHQEMKNSSLSCYTASRSVSGIFFKNLKQVLTLRTSFPERYTSFYATIDWWQIQPPTLATKWQPCGLDRSLLPCVPQYLPTLLLAF